MSPSFKLLFFSAFFFIFLQSSMACVNSHWEGDVSSDWNLAANWENNTLPANLLQVAVVDPAHYINPPVITGNSAFTPLGLIVQNNGQLTINGNFGALGETRVLNGSSVTVLNGTWTIAAGNQLSIEDNGSEVIVNGGAIVSQGDIVINGNTNGSGANPSLNILSGSVSVANDFIFAENTSDQPQLNISNGVLSISGDIVNSGTNANINMSGGTVNLMGNCDLERESDEIVMNGGTINIAGNLNFDGTAILNGGAIAFTGAGPQNISSSSGVSFYDMIINNSGAGVTLVDPVSVSNTLTLTDGILHSPYSDLLTIEDDATVTGVSNSSFVDGWCRKRGNDAFTFPIGDGSLYRPISISAPSNISDEFSSIYYYSDPTDLYSMASMGPGLNNVSTEEYWELNRDAGNSNVYVTLSWNSNSGTISNIEHLKVARWNGANWQNHGNGGTTGDVNNGTISSELPVNNFSPFTIGSGTSLNILPVKWLSFSAHAFQDEVRLSWITATEKNNSHFDVERSEDGHLFEKIGQVSALTGGNSQEQLNYSFSDNGPIVGVNYYRVKQVDLDGTHEFTKTEAVQFIGRPSINGDVWKVVCQKTAENENYTLSFPEMVPTVRTIILSSSGKVVADQEIQVRDRRGLLPMPSNACPGIYMVQVFAQLDGQQKEAVLKLPVY